MMRMRACLWSVAVLLLGVPTLRADEKRYEFLLSRLNIPISLDVAEAPLPIFLTTIEDLSSLPGYEKDPAKMKVTILVNEKQFKAESEGTFDLDKLAAIKLPGKLRGVSLSTALQLICEQLDGVYLVGKEFIEIVPAGRIRRELGLPEDDRRNLMPLVHCNIKKISFSKAIEELAEKHDRSIVLSAQVIEKIPTQEITMKLANVPFETAIELLAAMVDLKVVPKGDAYFVTNKKQADEMIAEQRKRDPTPKPFETTSPPMPEPKPKK